MHLCVQYGIPATGSCHSQHHQHIAVKKWVVLQNLHINKEKIGIPFWPCQGLPHFMRLFQYRRTPFLVRWYFVVICMCIYLNRDCELVIWYTNLPNVKSHRRPGKFSKVWADGFDRPGGTEVLFKVELDGDFYLIPNLRERFNQSVDF